MDEARSYVFILNARAGTIAGNRAVLDDLRDRLHGEGIDASFHLLEPEELEGASELLPKTPGIVVIGGGDGTLHSVINQVAGSEHIVGVLPLGTFNHFARSLGIPLNLAEAVEVLVEGVDRPVDLGSVNGELFLNTCSLGLYPRLTRMREDRRQRHAHWPRWVRWIFDTLASGYRVLLGWRLLRFRLELDGKTLDDRVPTLIITNNMVDSPMAQRPLDRGELVIYIPAVISRLSLLWTTLRAIFTGPREVEPLELVRTERATIRVPSRTPMSFDGEVMVADELLEVRSHPGCLTVRVPAEAPSGES